MISASYLQGFRLIFPTLTPFKLVKRVFCVLLEFQLLGSKRVFDFFPRLLLDCDKDDLYQISYFNLYLDSNVDLFNEIKVPRENFSDFRL